MSKSLDFNLNDYNALTYQEDNEDQKEMKILAIPLEFLKMEQEQNDKPANSEVVPRNGKRGVQKICVKIYAV